MKKQFFKFAFVAITILTLSISGCKKDDDHDHDNEQELITTVKATFTPVLGGGSPVEFTFSDIDGDGGNAPVITNGTLAANTSYSLALEFLNESETPAENKNSEIISEGKEHQVFFQTASGLNLSFSYSDQDADGKPIGLSALANTTAASSGNLKITLRHEPNKGGANVASGDITNAGGETDVEVNFNVTVN